MFIIGITGGIGCGKSTAASVCRAAGLPVIDADDISRQVTAAGGSAMPEVLAVFGQNVADARGSLDRQAMARKVFQNHRALDQLSQIIHRQVTEIISQQVDLLAQKKARAVVLDVPIPVQQGFLDLCDQVWVVWANDDIRLERLESRGMDHNEARRRMNMQMNREEYARLADHVLENNGSKAEFIEQVSALLAAELGQRGIRILKAKAESCPSDSNIEPEQNDITVG
jgi:dephospho-CoA kinase